MSDPLKELEIDRDEDGAATVRVVPNVPSSVDMKSTPLTGFLQIDNPTSEEQDQLKEVWDYVVESSKSDLRTEQLMTLRHIEQRLATPRLGQSRLDQLHQYVTVDRQAKSAEKLRDSFLR